MGSTHYSLITVMETISETSMPLNEFVIYRKNHYANVRQYVIVCDKADNTKMKLPEDLQIFYVGRSKSQMKKIVVHILKECSNTSSKVIVHLHQIKSALLFFRAMWVHPKEYRTLFSVHSVYALRNIKYRAASTLLAIMSDRTICVSESSYDTYSPVAKMLKGSCISAIENGVDLERIDDVIHASQGSIVKNRERTLVYVGRLIPIKNQRFLVNLFGTLNRCRMIFVGAEDEKKEISSLIKQKGYEDRITVTGMISREDVFKILATSDIYISSSTVEGLPVSVLEAMYVGLPTVLSDIAPHKELADKVEALKILPLENADEWTQIINSYLTLPEESLEKIGSDCRSGAKAFFSLSAMHQKYDLIYDSLLH